MGFKIRVSDCKESPQHSIEAPRTVASRRDGGLDWRVANVYVAGAPSSQPKLLRDESAFGIDGLHAESRAPVISAHVAKA